MPNFNPLNNRERRDMKAKPGQGQKLELEPPKQANLQFVDDTWERLLNALERLEQVTENFRNLSASRLDNHPDKHQIQEDEVDIRSEVHLQIKALQRVIHPIKDEVSWLVEDFLAWFGGREPRKLVQTDEYALPILKCLSGTPYVLPTLPEAPPLTQPDMMRTIEALGAGLHASDKIVDTYVQNPDQQASRNRHLRGSAEQGIQRLQRLHDPWVASFLILISKPSGPKTIPSGPKIAPTSQQAGSPVEQIPDSQKPVPSGSITPPSGSQIPRRDYQPDSSSPEKPEQGAPDTHIS